MLFLAKYPEAQEKKHQITNKRNDIRLQAYDMEANVSCTENNGKVLAKESGIVEGFGRRTARKPR